MGTLGTAILIAWVARQWCLGRIITGEAAIPSIEKRKKRKAGDLSGPSRKRVSFNVEKEPEIRVEDQRGTDERTGLMETVDETPDQPSTTRSEELRLEETRLITHPRVTTQSEVLPTNTSSGSKVKPKALSWKEACQIAEAETRL